MITNLEFKEKLLFVVSQKTVYANGMFGQVIIEDTIMQKARQLPKWYTYERKKMLRSLILKDYFGFDCICLIKGVLWGWNGNTNKVNGGAVYESNGVPDVTEDGMLNRCSEISSDFSKIEIGEYLWTDGHCGVYIGDGLAVECTPKWDNGVQITAVHNIAEKQGYNGRTWRRHGKLPYVEYVSIVPNAPTETEKASEENVSLNFLTLEKGKYRGNEQIKTVQRILKSLGYYKMDIDGSFGNGTKNAVEDFQAESGLESDGIVGRKTWESLLKG